MAHAIIGYKAGISKFLYLLKYHLNEKFSIKQIFDMRNVQKWSRWMDKVNIMSCGLDLNNINLKAEEQFHLI